MACGEQRVGVRERGVAGHIFVRDGLARLHDVAADEPGRGRALADCSVCALACRGADDEMLTLEREQRGGVGAEQSRRLLDDGRDDCIRVELGREEAARAREVLRQRARRRAPTRTCAARSSAPRAAPARCCASSRSSCANVRGSANSTTTTRVRIAADADREQRRARRGAPGVGEALVRRQVGCGEDGARRLEHDPRRAELADRDGQLVAARDALARRAPPRSRRRAPRPQPVPRRRTSPRATPARPAATRSGRSRAARAPAACARRSSPRCAARARRARRTPRAARRLSRRASATGPRRRRRARPTSRPTRPSARRARS